jgi:hypothetical protein
MTVQLIGAESSLRLSIPNHDEDTTMRGVFALIAIICSGSLQAAEHFLDEDEISNLKPHAQVAGTSHYVMPGGDPSKYDKLIVGSVTFYFAEDSKAKDIDADEAKHISDAMKAAMVGASLDKAEVVISPGPGTAILNVAITEIDMQNKKRGLLGYTPVGLVVTTAGNLSGLRMKLKDARIEGELVDSESGNTVSVFRIDEIGNWDDKKGLSWDDLKTSFEQSLSKGIAASRAPQ